MEFPSQQSWSAKVVFVVAFQFLHVAVLFLSHLPDAGGVQGGPGLSPVGAGRMRRVESRG